ncbi:GMC family oxidoreductase N-terminal domain-containing protein [Streptomyces sp. NPDC096934]|uniref:GMC family oxidoreductase n=1 Tax=Streptomyces sp. NPDC096934 TaxID=3155551 RepID=UPI0033333030
MATYDYVIVGAGSAGCVLAARLSEDPEVRVALIEAGGPDAAQEIAVPAAFSQLFKTEFDWDLDSEPEPGLGGRRMYLPRGKTFGGSSSINAMIYMRGNRADYDGWALSGAKGWSYDEVLPYFRRAEDNERGESAFHGVRGPLAVSDSRSSHPLTAAFINAGVEAGYRYNDDFNGESQWGVGSFQVTQRGGMRCSTAVAYLHPVIDRPNLTVLARTTVHRVVVQGTSATGVEVAGADGAVRVIHAEREVILSAGAYESPKLLMLSGIGPESALGSSGIKVVADLPVGQGLTDHFFTPLNFRTNVETLMTAASSKNAAMLQSEGRGPLTSNVGEAGGFMSTRAGLQAPDIQMLMSPVLFHEEALGVISEHGFAFGPCVLSPASRGEVTLRSTRPDSAPRITHRYLTARQDQETLVSGIRLALDIASQQAAQTVITEPFDVPEADSDAAILDWARKSGMTLFHPTSTCAIGSVVDSELHVVGVTGLRVVDASVFPAIPRGNTNAPTIMVAERAADLIKASA